MKEIPARLQTRQRYFPFDPRIVFFIVMALWLSGCGVRKRPSIPWATAVQVKPAVQSRAARQGGVPEEAAPELRLELPPFATILIPVRSGPPRPRVSPPSSVSAGTDAEKLEAPMIAPQLTPQERAAAQQETNQSLSIAEKNLAGTRGKSLNAAQADLVSKIKGFLKDAREAAQTGDWSRARSLAKKAEVLSEELVQPL